MALTVGRDALGSAPVPGLQAVAGALIELIDRVELVQSNRRELRELSTRIVELAKLVDTTRRNIQTQVPQNPQNHDQQSSTVHGLLRASSQQLDEPTNQICKTLASLRDQAEGLSRDEYMLDCLNSKQDAKILVEIRQGVDEAINFFQLHCVLTIKDTIRQIKELQAQYSKTQDDEKHDRILRSLPHLPDAGHNAAVNVGKSDYLKGTRAELFIQLNYWAQAGRDAERDKGICLLSGGAGTGKSTIASEFARRLLERGTLGASFFFVRDVQDLSSAKHFFPTIAYQIAQYHPTLRSIIATYASNHLRFGHTQQMTYQAESLVILPLQDPAAKGILVPMVIVVDALDECTDAPSYHLPRLLKLLVRCARETKVLRILLTSRPGLIIEDTLLSSEFSSDVHTISLHDTSSTESAADDIAMFLSHRLSQTSLTHALTERRPDIMTSLVERAEGLFLYARTAMDFLHSYPDHLEERVDMLLSDISPGERGVALGVLDELYLRVLQSAFPPYDMQLQKDLRRRVRSVLSCVALLRDHISINVLEALTQIPCEVAEPVLNQLRAVILFNKDNPSGFSTFRPIHATFTQFLVDKRRCTNPLYLVDVRRQHRVLSENCLKTLMSLTRNICQLTDPSKPKEAIQDLDARLSKHVPHHVRYACMHWAAHLVRASNSKRLEDLLEEFAKSRMLMWLETLGYMGRLDLVKTIIDTACKLKHSEEIQDILTRHRRCTTDYYTTIHDCPYSVYSLSFD